MKILRIPRSRTAGMQLLQLFAASGHVYWVAGVITREKLARFIPKIVASFPILRDTPGRAYDRKQHRASVHLVVIPLEADTAYWALVSSHGKGGLADSHAPNLGVVRDMRLKGQHLTFLHYELLYQEKRLPGCAGSTWTWRITPARYRELEAQIVQVVRERGSSAVTDLITINSSMPLFSGVRGQVMKLNAEVRKLARKRSNLVLPPTQLPYLRRQRIYDEVPLTLQKWLTTTPGGA
ncbi:MAG: hypothetical protein KUL86_14240 [Castellaniella sp.]|nr:hypothetical protein [Castellaniella sp.]